MTTDSNAAGGNSHPSTDDELIARLMRFYSVSTLLELVRAQDHHIEKLQQRLAPTLDGGFPRTPREG